MKKVMLFVAVILIILSLISLRGITGLAVADTQGGGSDFANMGISAIGLVIVALVFMLYQRDKLRKQRAEEVWEKERK